MNQQDINNSDISIFGDWINKDIVVVEEPFTHIVIDDFLKQDVIDKVFDEIPVLNDDFHKYYNNLFCCTKLIYVKYDNKKFKSCVIKKGKKFNIKNKTIRFSKDLANWKESSTVYIDDISIGEFQIHNHRDCIKFRWSFEKILNLFKDNFEIIDLSL